ncbi:hypothetical protein ACNFIC_04830 [Pseudomonas sp. NY15463]|uniref:hypothetical protein n=1 Tax=Pseudomonas sp. NY15463 TaxID=3400361 RepID=UPI003A8A69CC
MSLQEKTSDVQGSWIPLSQYFDYICDFFHLDRNLKTNAARQKYHDGWMEKYQKSISAWTDYDVAIWSVRARQSLKLCFSSTYFALESQRARKQGVMASAYYLGYYSVLHAMWSVIYLDPQQTTKNVYDITHSKILNLFHSDYAHGNNSVLGYNAKKIVGNLRFLREYYSYRMPLNSPLDQDHELAMAFASLGGFVKHCIQLAHLQSQLLMKSAMRKKKASASLPLEQLPTFADEFFAINGKEREMTQERLLDPADEFALHESMSKGCDIMAHSLAFDHMFDDFMTCLGGTNPGEEIISETRRLVGAALYPRK